MLVVVVVCAGPSWLAWWRAAAGACRSSSAAALTNLCCCNSHRHTKTRATHSWEPGSYGYHGDDGLRYASSGKGDAYGPRFGAGDTVGACLHLGRGEIFFT